MGKSLIIVESPSKAKTIKKYLGREFEVDASGGHIRDLPENGLGINIKNNFQPTYVVNPSKREVVKRLSEKAKKAESVYLATDPDREGEAISWHLAYLLGIPPESKSRIVFNEISKRSVTKALEAPREININLVNAQQARRVLDRLVGYKLSPLLCRRIQNRLSAGRVQSVALRLIVEREQEIQNFVPKEYWTVIAELCPESGEQKDIVFKASLALKEGKKFRPENKQQADEVLQAARSFPWAVKSVKRQLARQHAPAPFTTSTLQQDASNKLGLSSPLTMQIAQSLYEGVGIEGEGQVALVTYIRTDSVRVSEEAQREALSFIESRYGKDYLPPKPNVYKSKKTAQDAHEAIRPIALERTPESLKDKLPKNHFRLYKLIYDRFLASQMAEAVYDSLVVDIQCGPYTFRCSGRTLIFKGFTIAYDEYREADPGKEREEGEENARLPNLSGNDPLKLIDIKGEQKFTKPPSRYTDASLVKAMEEKGIGRPSTYASIIAVLLKRTYTVKEGRYLKPTPLAFTVNELLIKYFPDIVNVEFTAHMEEKLDEIEEGGRDWRQLVADFYPGFELMLKRALEESVEKSDQACEKCGAQMVVRVGRYGKFLACPNYPGCKNIKPLPGQLSGEKCEKCGADMEYREGKYGRYLACTNYPNCSNIKVEGEEKSDVKCPSCGKEMVIREGRYGKYLHCPECKHSQPYAEAVAKCPSCGGDVVKKLSKSRRVFYGCSNYPRCKFASWDIPAEKNCPRCGKYMVIKTLKSGGKLQCSDKGCGYEEQN
jgi:DNA topoisomerase-1